MYMYLFLPKDGCDAGTPVAPEEKNIVDMPAMDFCCSNPSPQSEVFSCSLLCTLEFLQKQLSERNANSHHQVCYNFKKKKKKKDG